MKKLLMLLSMLPVVATAQQVELGVNGGNISDVSASIRFCHHFKLGVGYGFGTMQEDDLLGGTSRVKISMPYFYGEYYNHRRKHEFYYGVDGGLMSMSDVKDIGGTITESGLAIGAHAGYSLKIVRRLYGNGQIGYMHFHLTANEDRYHGTATSDGVIIPMSVGLHYIVGR
jgi:hypothetical protein